MLKLSLSSPWDNHYKMVYQLLSRDPEIRVSSDLTEPTEGCYNFNILSNNTAKLKALRKVLRTNITFGNVILRMTFIDTNNAQNLGDDKEGEVIPTIDDWNTAFTGNELFCQIKTVGKGLYTLNYAIFAHEIVDYFSDDLTDINGYAHMLPAQIAKEICRFVDDLNILVCTSMLTPNQAVKTTEIF